MCLCHYYYTVTIGITMLLYLVIGSHSLFQQFRLYISWTKTISGMLKYRSAQKTIQTRFDNLKKNNTMDVLRKIDRMKSLIIGLYNLNYCVAQDLNLLFKSPWLCTITMELYIERINLSIDSCELIINKLMYDYNNIII